tara:strand:- start:280 stop:627 length:348 start_codon:yes stop_codon:yes gene_type:complete
MSTERLTARVKWFNPRAGYGFLTDCKNADDVFVHHTEITTSGNVYKTLTAGEYVEYVTTTDPTGKVLATNVTGILKGPLLCERPRPKKKTKGARGKEDEDSSPEQAAGEPAVAAQ